MENSNLIGAEFSECRQYRYALWRIWDSRKSLVAFVGLNPSKANELRDDPTIKRVKGLAMQWGFGGVYMLNCFAYISTDPEQLVHNGDNKANDEWLKKIVARCNQVIFAWGAFDIVKTTGRDKELLAMFPEAMALKINKDGSPRHPLYVPKDTMPVLYSK